MAEDQIERLLRLADDLPPSLEEPDLFCRAILEHRRNSAATWKDPSRREQLFWELKEQVIGSIPAHLFSSVDWRCIRHWVTDWLPRHYATSIAAGQGLQPFIDLGWESVDPKYLRDIGLVTQRRTSARMGKVGDRTRASTSEYEGMSDQPNML